MPRPSPLSIGWILIFVLAAAGCGDEYGDLPVAPYIPSPESVVTDMLELAGVGPDDYLIDLGSGDGRIVLTAATVFGAGGLGVEIREDLVALSNHAAQAQGVADRVTFRNQDLFDTDISRASVLTMYLLPETVNRLKGKLLRELEPGARILSHDYPIEGWEPERFVQMNLDDKIPVTGVTRTNLYLYRVPAHVAGRWRVSLPVEFGLGELALDLTQEVTRIAGTVSVAGDRHPIDDAALNGRQLSFHVPALDAMFSGEVSDGGIRGDAVVGPQFGLWRATRGEP